MESALDLVSLVGVGLIRVEVAWIQVVRGLIQVGLDFVPVIFRPDPGRWWGRRLPSWMILIFDLRWDAGSDWLGQCSTYHVLNSKLKMVYSSSPVLNSHRHLLRSTTFPARKVIYHFLLKSLITKIIQQSITSNWIGELHGLWNCKRAKGIEDSPSFNQTFVLFFIMFQNFGRSNIQS